MPRPGTIAFSRAEPEDPLLARICLTIDAPGDSHDGVRFYAPAARVMPFGWERRFTLHLLKDSSIDAETAAKVPLESLALDDKPLLDLFSVRYYRGGDHFVALDPQMTPHALKSLLGSVPIGGRPFVVSADGAQIYLGAFWSSVSSLMPRGPYVMTESVTSQGFAIQPPPNGMDLRSDVRIVSALRESGKLAP